MAKVILVPPQPVEQDFQLTLSKTEAQTLVDVLNRVGGYPKISRRKNVDAILEAFRKENLVYGSTSDLVIQGTSMWFTESK